MSRHHSRPARLHRKVLFLERIKSVELTTIFTMINTLLLIALFCKVIL